MNQICCHCREPVVVALSETVFDCDVLALDIASFDQALAECGHEAPTQRLSRH
jgi:hypothetical protein